MYVCMYVYVYMCVCVCTYIYIYIYIYKKLDVGLTGVKNTINFCVWMHNVLVTPVN